MASLTGSATLGNTSVSSLLRSANSLAASNQTFADNQAAYNFEQNVITDPEGAWNTYQTYLKGRISGLNALGGPVNGSKAISLTNTLSAANSKMVSTEITQENIQVMAGNATPTDKYNLINNQYIRAVGNGDLSLAQSLMSQSYSLSQTIQDQAQTSAAAAETLAKAGATKTGTADAGVASTLQKDLAKFNTDYAHAGTANANKVLQDFVTAHKDQYATLGVTLKPGVKPNYFDVVSGTNQAIFAAFNAAGDAVAPFATDGGQSYYDKATGVVGKIPTIYGSMNANQLDQAAANPNQFSTKLDPDLAAAQSGVGGKANPQVGFKYDPKQGIIPVYSTSPWVNVPNNLNYRLQQLGLRVVGNTPGTGTGVEVGATNKTPGWLQKAIPSNATTHIFIQANGDLQFESQGKGGVGIFTATTNNQLYERDGVTGAYSLLGGQPGGQKGINAAGPKATGHNQSSLNGPSLSLNSDFVTPNQLAAQSQKITTQQAQEAATAKANQAAAMALLPKSLPPLPNITIAPPTATTSPHGDIQPAIYPGAAQTPMNVQPVAPVRLQGPQINVQGGNVNLGGGGSIRI